MADAEERRERLIEVFREASVCTKCRLSETRTKVVFGAGNADADLMFVGEAPGAEEDRQGLPFVGRAGGLLNQLLEGIGMSREDVMIANVLKCRPPGNRDPQPDEIDTCRPYLERQVELIEPRVIATLGNFATKLLTANPTGITKVRGAPQVHELGGRTVFVLPLFHPAAALRTPAWPRPCARTSRPCRSCSSRIRPRLGAPRSPVPLAPARTWPRRARPTSSASSVDRADHLGGGNRGHRRPHRRRAAARRRGAGLRRARELARPRWCAAPAARLGSTSP